MSIVEIKNYCETILPYQINVKVRLKNHREVLVGRVIETNDSRFVFQPEGADVLPLPYKYVANISHC